MYFDHTYEYTISHINAENGTSPNWTRLKKQLGVFFLTGLIWARTVFCIDIGNIVFIHMMKIHLPHMYMIFVECHRKQLCFSILQYPQAFNTFRIISDSLKPFTPNSLGPFQLLQRHFLLFFWLWSRSISSHSLLYSNLVWNFLTFFVPRPVMVVKLNHNIWSLQKEHSDTFFVFKSIVNPFVDWTKIPASNQRMDWQCIWKRRRYQNAPFEGSKYFWLSFTTITGRGTKRWGSFIQDSSKGANDSRCSAIKVRKKKKVSLRKLERNQRVRSERLERVAYDPKSVEKFGGIVE